MYSLLNAWEASGVKLDMDSSSDLQEARCVIDASKPGIVSKHPIRRILNNTRYGLRRFISFAMTAKLELDIPYYNDIHHQIPDLYTQHHGHSTSIHDANDVETKAAFPAFCHSKSLTACSALEKIPVTYLLLPIWKRSTEHWAMFPFIKNDHQVSPLKILQFQFCSVTWFVKWNIKLGHVRAYVRRNKFCILFRIQAQAS